MKQSHMPELEETTAIDVKHLLGLLRHWSWLLILAVILGAGTAFLVSRMQTPIYEAKTQVMLTRSSSEGPVTDITQALNSQQMTQTYVELLSQQWLLDSVAARVGGGELDKGAVVVSAATNTQIINITVEDPDPARAAQIADTLVQILIEQNENVQSKRYADAEASLNLQIQQMEEQISGVQAQLSQAKADAFSEQIVAAQSNIDSTQAAIAAAKEEIKKLRGLTAERAQSLLEKNRTRIEQLQEQMAGQLVESEELNTRLATDPKVQEDPALAASLQAKLSGILAAIEGSHQEIAALQEEMDWLAPLVEPGIAEQRLAEQLELLNTQQSLLPSYQQTYTDLLVSGKLMGTNDKITNLEKNLSLYQQIYLNLLDDRESVRLERMQNMPNIVQLNPSISSDESVRPRVLFNTVLAGIAALLLAVGILFLVEYLDDSIKTADQIVEKLKLPVIGYIAEIQRGPESAYVAEHPRSPVAEAYRTLRTNLEFANVDQPVRTLVVVSPNPGEGKSSVAANLAITLAQGGRRVLLIDADLRRPRVHRYLGLSNRKGLSDLFRSSVPVEQVISAWKNENLQVITSGGLPPNPADILASEKMANLLKTLQGKVDIVVIDAPPFLVADASILAARADGTLLVIHAGKTPLDSALFTVEQLKRAGARVLGVVLNRIPRSRAYSYSGYRGSYAYYQKEQGQEYVEPEEEKETPAAAPSVLADK